MLFDEKIKAVYLNTLNYRITFFQNRSAQEKIICYAKPLTNRILLTIIKKDKIFRRIAYTTKNINHSARRKSVHIFAFLSNKLPKSFQKSPIRTRYKKGRLFVYFFHSETSLFLTYFFCSSPIFHSHEQQSAFISVFP